MHHLNNISEFAKFNKLNTLDSIDDKEPTEEHVVRGFLMNLELLAHKW